MDSKQLLFIEIISEATYCPAELVILGLLRTCFNAMRFNSEKNENEMFENLIPE